MAEPPDQPNQPEQPTQPAPIPPQAPPPTPQTPAPAPAGGGRGNTVYLFAGLAVGLAIALIAVLVLVNRGGDEPAPVVAPPVASVPVQVPVSVPASPVTLPSPEGTDVPVASDEPVSKARIDGFYSGKYGFAFKASCKSGPCGGVAQSGAQFEIPYQGSSSYSGHSSLRDTCSKGGVHVQAPLKVDMKFHPTDAAVVGDEWMATKVDISLHIHRNPFVKKVRTSSTIITTLTCPGYNQSYQWTGIAA